MQHRFSDAGYRRDEGAALTAARWSKFIRLWNAYGRTRELRAFKDFRGTIRWGFWNTDEEVPGGRRENPHGRLVGPYPSSSSSAFASMRSRVSKPSVNQA